MTSLRAVESAEDRQKVLHQVHAWRERLIDLTRANPLLGINRSRTSKLLVVEPEASFLLTALVIRGDKLRMPLVRRRLAGRQLSPPPETQPEAAWEVRPGDVQFDGEPVETGRRLRRIRDNARTTVQERGVTTLHLTLGALHWTDEYLGESVAPLWLIPCELGYSGPDEPLVLMATDEDAQLNPALALYVRERYQRELPQLPDDPDGDTLKDLLRQTTELLGQDWRITDEVWLSTFSFEALAIYQDLERLAEAAVTNDVVRAFAGATVSVEATESLGDDTDELPVPDVVPIPALPTDSSQLGALANARAGRHVLVHGPPGTGKSQTIANLIADALAQGKTVLFVSAKMAALEVVYERLAQLRLARFCLEAHSTKAGKKRVIDELRRTLEAAQRADDVDYQPELSRYLARRKALNEGVVELHRRRDPMGCSIHRAIGLFALLQHLPAVSAPLPWSDPTTVTSQSLEEAIDLLGDLQTQATVSAEQETHPWRGCQPRDASRVTLERLCGALGTVHSTVSRVLAAAPSLEPFLGSFDDRSLDDLARASEAFVALSQATWLPTAWTSDAVPQLERRLKLLRRAAALSRVAHLAPLVSKAVEHLPWFDKIPREAASLVRDPPIEGPADIAAIEDASHAYSFALTIRHARGGSGCELPAGESCVVGAEARREFCRKSAFAVARSS